MPTTLGRPYALSWRGRPPHMLDPDIPVWWSWLDLYGYDAINLFYDVQLGGPDYTPEQLKDPLTKMWYNNLAKRADALIETDDQVWIIEVTADPGLRAIGQLQTYRALWLRDPKIAKPETLILVSHTIEPDLLDAATMYGLLCYIV